MTLIFYFAPNSTASVTASVLDELEHGLPTPLAKRIELSIQAGDTRTSDYLSSVNPNGRVPALVHDGVPLWESAALTMYLGETFGVREHGDADRPSLYPALGPQRGEAMKWIVWANTTVATAGGYLAASVPAGTPGGVEEGSQDAVAADDKVQGAAGKARKELAQALEILDGALKGKDYLLGSQYCLADTHLWTLVSWLAIMGVSIETYPDIKSWMAKVGARPALKGV